MEKDASGFLSHLHPLQGYVNVPSPPGICTISSNTNPALNHCLLVLSFHFPIVRQEHCKCAIKCLYEFPSTDWQGVHLPCCGKDFTVTRTLGFVWGKPKS